MKSILLFAVCFNFLISSCLANPLDDWVEHHGDPKEWFYPNSLISSRKYAFYFVYSPSEGIFLVHDLKDIFKKELVSKRRWAEFTVQLAHYKRMGQLEFFDLTLGEQGFFTANALVQYLQEPGNSLGLLRASPMKRPQNELTPWQNFSSWLGWMKRSQISSPEIEPFLEDGRCGYEWIETDTESSAQ